MEYKKLFDGSQIPALGLGTWHMGGGFRSEHGEDAQSIAAIAYAIERGITHIDTAELYGNGHTEELVGKAAKAFTRHQLFITTKVSPQHLTYRGVLQACERSLKRLATDYIDLYLIHWPNPLARMKKVMPAFDELIDQGKIRFVGVSNFSVKDMQAAQAYAQHQLATNQVHYNFIDQSAKERILPYCLDNNILLTAYGPLAEGELAEPETALHSELPRPAGKSSVQVALRWLLDQPGVITIPKALNLEHIDEILGALGWHLK